MEDFSVAQIQEDQLLNSQKISPLFSLLNNDSNEWDIMLTTLNGSMEDGHSFSIGNGSWNGSSENEQDLYVPYEQRPETYIVPVLFFIIFVIGVLGNGTLIAIFIRHRTMRTIPNL